MNVAGGSHRITRFLKAGPLTMLLGALLLLGGLVQTTTSRFTFPSCPEGTVLLAKFDFDGSHYVFEKPDGNEHVVTITDGTASGGSWTSTLPVSDVLVKGGTDTKDVSYSPPQTSGTFSNDGLLVGNGQTPDISDVQFCGPGNEATTTSAATTTSGVTTTSAPASSTSTSTTTTTTTVPPGSTTSSPTTETTTSTSTTTVPPTSTSSPTTGPTTTGPTSTTRPTSTTGGATSTTSVSGTTEVVTTTTLRQQGSTTTIEPVTSTTVLSPGQGGRLPFTGGRSAPLIVLGVLALATGAALTFSGNRRSGRSRA